MGDLPSSSPLWTDFALKNLTHPQRVASDAGYSHFIDLVGDGDVHATHLVDRDTHLTKMEPMSATTSEENAIQFIFLDVNNTFKCSDHASITGTNIRVDELNGKIMARLDGPVMILHSLTRMDPHDAKHLRPRSRSEQHQGESERGWTEVSGCRNALEAPASSPPSDNVLVHLATEWSDSGTETISTPPMLCNHGEQVSRPDTLKDLL